jgi:hypothetical protein
MDQKEYIEDLTFMTRHYINSGYELQAIIARLQSEYTVGDIYLSYNAAKILIKDSLSFAYEK